MLLWHTSMTITWKVLQLKAEKIARSLRVHGINVRITRWLFQALQHSSADMTFLSGSDGEGNGTPLQYSCLENPMDGGAWKAAVRGVTEGQTWLSDFTFTFHFHALEKAMAPHSSVLAWRIPGTREPGGLLSMGSHRVGHDWSDLAAAMGQKTVVWLTGDDALGLISHPSTWMNPGSIQMCWMNWSLKNLD